jgi:hypothetical protein
MSDGYENLDDEKRVGSIRIHGECSAADKTRADAREPRGRVCGTAAC